MFTLLMNISRGVFRNILWLGRHKQKVQISVHGAYKEPKEGNTINNKKKYKIRFMGGRGEAAYEPDAPLNTPLNNIVCGIDLFDFGKAAEFMNSIVYRF